MSMFNLLAQKRFGPFFGVQFLGALNDNLFKNTMVILIAFRAATEAESGMLINLAAGLFILPLFETGAVGVAATLQLKNGDVPFGELSTPDGDPIMRGMGRVHRSRPGGPRGR